MSLIKCQRLFVVGHARTGTQIWLQGIDFPIIASVRLMAVRDRLGKKLWRQPVCQGAERYQKVTKMEEMICTRTLSE